MTFGRSFRSRLFPPESARCFCDTTFPRPINTRPEWGSETASLRARRRSKPRMGSCAHVGNSASPSQKKPFEPFEKVHVASSAVMNEESPLRARCRETYRETSRSSDRRCPTSSSPSCEHSHTTGFLVQASKPRDSSICENTWSLLWIIQTYPFPAVSQLHVTCDEVSTGSRWRLPETNRCGFTAAPRHRRHV